tara:strand:+ start:3431 stop:4702 length:1272 start_codon:yes stop_codon:yes gene_type:complete
MMILENLIKFSIIASVIALIGAFIDFMIRYNFETTSSLLKNIFNRKKKAPTNNKINIALLTNEIPPIVYGGVATWIINFINMMENSEKYNVIPVFLAYNDTLPEEYIKKYRGIRIINSPGDIQTHFKDIDICVNNLWVSLETIIEIKTLFPKTHIITVCHSLIRMEHITNLGSQYTNNFNDQETTFQHSDSVVLISNAEEEYYKLFGYDKFRANTRVIYNSYIPKYDDIPFSADYTCNDVGYLGRHVPRKRPEIPIKAVEYLKQKTIKVFNMGVDYDKYDNAYWRELDKLHGDQLNIIPFTSDEKIKDSYWKNIGVNSIIGIYEPFGYTCAEAIDRGIPIICQNIDGPKEIVEEVKAYIYSYEVDKDDYARDIVNFSDTLEKFWNTPPEVRRTNAIKARKALDKLRPEIIKKEWEDLMDEIIH